MKIAILLLCKEQFIFMQMCTVLCLGLRLFLFYFIIFLFKVKLIEANSSLTAVVLLLPNCFYTCKM